MTLAAGQDGQALSLPGSLAVGESPEQPSAAPQEEQLSLTPEVRLPGVPGRPLGRFSAWTPESDSSTWMSGA